jgi:FK506-binding nuclear protein
MDADIVENVAKSDKKKKKRKGQDGSVVDSAPSQSAQSTQPLDTSVASEGKKKEKEKKKEKKSGTHAPLPEQELPGGLKVQDFKIGDGKMAKPGARVSMRYIGKLTNGNVFDSNTKGKPVRNVAAAERTKLLNTF